MRRAIGAVGRILITIGLLILAFVGYQLWGTGLYTARAQDELEQQFNEQRERAPTTALDPVVRPPEGDAVANIRIPTIDVDWMVVEGVSVADLQKGPGHFPETPIPGELGNAAIAGHRTTYGAPFHRVDELAVGDDIVVTTLAGTYTYVLEEEPFVVAPTQVEVLLPQGYPAEPGIAELTLTTCHPKYSAAQRLIVKAVLDPGRSAVARAPTIAFTGEVDMAEGLTGDPAARLPMIAWGAVALLVGAGWWLVFHRHPRWTTWLVGVVPFGATLFMFYSSLERFLGPYTNPAG